MIFHYVNLHRSTLCFNPLTLVLCILSFFLYTSPADAAQVAFQWSPNTEPNIACYKVYVGYRSRDYHNHYFIDPENHTNCVISGLEENQTYYFAVTAKNTNGLESAFSNELMTTTSSDSTETLSTTADSTETLSTTADSTETLSTTADSTETLSTTADSTETLSTTADSTETLSTTTESTDTQLASTDTDPNQTVDEAVVVTPESDLTGSWIDLRGEWKGPNYWIAGTFRFVNFSSEKVKNILVRFYQSTNVDFDETDIQMGEKRVNVEPGSWVDIPLNAKGLNPELVSYIIALVDATDLLPESDECNNVIVSWYLQKGF